MNGVIIYQGKYGATQQYAEWLGIELHLPVISSKEINGEALDKFRYLLIGTSVYIGKLQIEKWLKKNLLFLIGKKIFFFQVAGTPPLEKEKRQAYNLSGIPKDLFNQCEFYFLAGSMVRSKLSMMDKFMLKMGAWLANDPEDRSNMLTDYNEVKKENILLLANSVRQYLHEDAVFV